MNVTPSAPVVKVLAAAVRRAARLDFPFVGTENLLIALADANSSGRALDKGMLRAHTAARGAEHWAGDDDGICSVPDADVAGLMRAAHHHARQETALPVSVALELCLRQAIEDAGDGVLTTEHLALSLLRLESGRAAEVFTVRHVNVEARAVAVRKAAEPEEAPAVWLLRKSGALQGEEGGGVVRWLTRLSGKGGFGGPVLSALHHEAARLAVACGRAPGAVDLVAAVLTVDQQLAAAGRTLRPEYETGGATALRAAGVDQAALAEVSPEAGVERALAGARLVAARRNAGVVGTADVLGALLDSPDPVGVLLREHGVVVAPVAPR